MPRTLRVTLDITVDDLRPEIRQARADDMMVSVEELLTLNDATLGEVTSPLTLICDDDICESLFEGSDAFARYTQVKILSAGWTGEIIDEVQDAAKD